MQVVFLGVGEACDQDMGNTSLLVQAQEARILLDCGFSVAHSLFSHLHSPDDLDAIWISHSHGDHFFSLPLILLRLWESGRSKALTVLGPPDIEDVAVQSIQLAYPGFADKFTFPLHFQSVQPGDPLQFLGCWWQTAWTRHPRPNLGLRLDGPQAGLYYSGDGRPGADVLSLIQGCSLVVHEGFKLEQAVHGHGTVMEVMDLARQAGAERLAVVHMQRDERRLKGFQARAWLQGMTDVHGFLPQPGERVFLP
ncbi:MAG: MBL fold metallo-hydrolase [Desulfovermiculus sp.]|nr:MBL fold metallo-hydrolase [Desulfovermiculus sp.]